MQTLRSLTHLRRRKGCHADAQCSASVRHVRYTSAPVCIAAKWWAQWGGLALQRLPKRRESRRDGEDFGAFGDVSTQSLRVNSPLTRENIISWKNGFSRFPDCKPWSWRLVEALSCVAQAGDQVSTGERAARGLWSISIWRGSPGVA